MIQDSNLKMDRIVPITTEIFNLEEGVDLILGMDWLRANTVGMSWDISDKLNFRPNVGLSEGANPERVVAQAEGAKPERGVPQAEGANPKRVVTQAEGAKPEREVTQAERAKLERGVSSQEEKFDIDIRIVSSLSEWDDVVTDSFAVGCIWYAGEDQSVATLWTDDQGIPVEGRLPPQYRKFAELFSQEGQKRLPKHGPCDMTIDIEPGMQPPSGHLYPLSHDELELLREYLNEMLETGKIRPSKSPAGAPIFFVPKPHGRGLRIVVDYRGLNAITIKDRYPLPLMTDLMDRVGNA